MNITNRCLPVGSFKAQGFAFIQTFDFLEDRVDGFENFMVNSCELAESHRIVHAVVLEVVHILGSNEGWCSSNSITIHVRKTALQSLVVEISRSAMIDKVNFRYINIIATYIESL